MRWVRIVAFGIVAFGFVWNCWKNMASPFDSGECSGKVYTGLLYFLAQAVFLWERALRWEGCATRRKEMRSYERLAA